MFIQTQKSELARTKEADKEDWYDEINFVEVVKELDHEGLFVCKQTLIFFSEAFEAMFEGEEHLFPAAFFHGIWKNWERQLAIYEKMVESPETWSIAKYEHTKVLSADLNLKVILLIF